MVAGRGVNFAGEGRLEFAQQQRVSAGFFGVLGVAPRYGRSFTQAEDVAGGPALVVLATGSGSACSTATRRLSERR